MCLDISEKITEKVRKRLSGGKVTFWKVFKRPEHVADSKPGVLYSGWMQSPYSPGWNESDRPGVTLVGEEADRRKMKHGAHVFNSAREARNWAMLYEVVVPVTVAPVNLVAGGTNGDLEASVFTKIYIDPKDYENALQTTTPRTRKTPQTSPA